MCIILSGGCVFLLRECVAYERPAKYCCPPCSTNCIVSLIILEVKTTAQYKLVGRASVGTGKTDMNKN